MIRTILVDDEPVILEDLKLMIKDFKNIEVVGAYTDPQEVLQELSILRPDCAFLDIEMSDLNGIELAAKLSEKYPDIEVMFITAYNHYATQAFEVNAIEYILKPVRPERLAKAITKISQKIKYRKSLAHVSLKIRSFGNFEVFVGHKPIRWTRTKPRELLAYLLQNDGKWVDKYKICDDLWRTLKPEKALASLQTAVWAIRKTLSQSGCMAKINYAHDSYQLNLPETEWDLQQFDDAYDIFLRTGLAERGKEAELLYTGEYLNGEDWLWADLIRESYAQKYRNLKQRLY
ncbi:response regulator containing CheY-like receiver and SARP domains [Desulfosporosinus acidiphilus SJ4]|uniref:Stage 0 sporulation protein A homolog n=1 Tax=Desulfosporosinus acidiphilus (strain DSM 22704 / JCM 16185 / SJ4) TaxID=646529 RepID=I4D706_DESAJ|nr:response regulator [Desulfosporosinus acidiphilus]AFM41580.1 response regulator containing CheY-like receiver and SARP domains [Desulfosporosinus acidiphilus SJ4]